MKYAETMEIALPSEMRVIRKSATVPRLWLSLMPYIGDNVALFTLPAVALLI
ncbi:MAG: hypothetical protein ACREVE_03945 [Gammaproteobacteria bacterium]